MPEVELHIHPNIQGAMQAFHAAKGDPLGILNVAPGASLAGVRAGMVYIHGDTQEWQLPSLQQWLQRYVMPRLVDDNPARVVWDA